MLELLETMKVSVERVVFTVADADSCFHPSYFEALNFAFINTSPRTRHVSIPRDCWHHSSLPWACVTNDFLGLENPFQECID